MTNPSMLLEMFLDKYIGRSSLKEINTFDNKPLGDSIPTIYKKFYEGNF